MRSWLAWVLAVAGAWHAAAESDAFPFRRPIEVPSPGWVAVALDARASSFAATELRLLAPTGEAVPFRLFDPSEGPGRRPARVHRVRRRPDGWRLTFDLGEEPPPHTRLVLELGAAAVAADCRLEGSPDARAWAALGIADLVRLGPHATLQRTAIDYPSNRHRYLRLHWPSTEPLPAVRAAHVATLGQGLEATAVEPRCAPRSEGGQDCHLGPLGPHRLLRRLDLDFGERGRAGFRLWAPRAGRWELLHEATLQPGSGTLRLPLLLPAAAADDLRLEIHGAVSPPRAELLRGIEHLAFMAPSAGTYRLAYGGLAATPGSAPTADPPPARPSWLAMGSEERSPWPTIPPHLAAPGAPLRVSLFRWRWPVRAAEASPGDLVALELTEEVYASSQPNLGDLRLGVDGAQLPHVRRRLDAPARVDRPQRLQPQPSASERRSETTLAIPRHLPSTALHLRAGAAPFQRRVRAFTTSTAGGPGEARSRTVFSRRWSCLGDGSLPCLLIEDLGRRSEDRLHIEIDDGDNPPLPSLEAELWRPRDALLFVWPPSGAVALYAGADLESPRYDLAVLADALAVRPTATATLEPGLPPSPRGVAWGRWGLVGASGLTAVALLLLLARTLRDPPSDEAEREERG